MRRIQIAPLNDQQRFLLGECVQAYLPLDESQQQEFERLVATEPYKGVQAMNTTWYEKGLDKGIEKERRESVRDFLEVRFGSLSPAVLLKIEQLTLDQLLALRKAILKAQSLRDLGLDD